MEKKRRTEKKNLARKDETKKIYKELTRHI